MPERVEKLVEFLKGKKTYFLVAGAFIYGGLIQIGACHHSALVDKLFLGGTIVALRAGVAKAQQAAATATSTVTFNGSN